jgi:hypothetical protein
MKPILHAFQNPASMQERRELQAFFLNDYRCKNSQENTGKPNSTTHQNDHIS